MIQNCFIKQNIFVAKSIFSVSKTFFFPYLYTDSCIIYLLQCFKMTKIGDRIKELRQQKKLTQAQLAELVGLTYIQIGRYEKHKSNPSSDVLQRLAEALDTSTDYLMNGNSEQIASSKVTDRDLINLFKKVEQLSVEDQNMVKTFLDALITKRTVQRLAS